MMQSQAKNRRAVLKEHGLKNKLNNGVACGKGKYTLLWKQSGFLKVFIPFKNGIRHIPKGCG